MKREFPFSRRWFNRCNIIPVVFRNKLSGPCSLLLAAILVLAPGSSKAGAIEAWARSYNTITNSVELAFRGVVDKLGDVVVAGFTDQAVSGRDMLTIKYSGKDGSLIWKRLYDGPAHSHDIARALALDQNNNIVIAGDSGGDIYIARYSASDGALLWQKRRDGSTNAFESLSAVVTDRNGNAIATGTASGLGQGDFYTAKYAAEDGAILWERRYDGPTHRFDQARAIAVDHNGDVLVTGLSVGETDDYYTAKYAAADGAILWEKRYEGPGNFLDSVSAITVDRSGNAIVAGGSFVTPGSYYRHHVIKYAAADGAVIWEQRGPFGVPAAVSTDANDDVVVTGQGTDELGTPRKFCTAKYAAADGALVWEKRYDSGFNAGDYAQALAVDSHHNVVIAGSSSNGTNNEYVTIKYAAADGALLWERRSGSAARFHSDAQSVAIDAAGNVIVTGHTYYAPDFSDLRTEKYDGATGTLLWRTDHNDTANAPDYAQAIALDADKNIVVTGSSGKGTNHVSYTAKYAATNGAILWERRCDELGDDSNYPAMMVLDAHGNAIVTGFSLSPAPSVPRHFTVKYRSADGALLWQRIGPAGHAYAAAILPSGDVVVAGSWYNGTNDFWSITRCASLDGSLVWEHRGPRGFARAVVVDPLGNVIATGESHLFSYDFYTIKIRGTDGTVLWDKHYDGHGTDRARALAVDPDGNIAVTGSVSIGSGLDIYTAKYRAADGSLLWERTYGRTPDDYDEAMALAVDRHGNVIVTGTSWSGTNFRSYTAKYAALGGELLWERSGPAGSGAAVAVDAAGDVVVAGNCSGGAYSNYYTVKYAGANGAVIWEKQYNGTASQDDIISSRHSLAISGDGVIAVTGSSDRDLGPGVSYDIATVVYWEQLPSVLVDRLSSAARVRIAAIPGRVYEVQRASDIKGPWTTLSTQTALANGVIEYLDNGSLSGSTFYRVRTD